MYTPAPHQRCTMLDLDWRVGRVGRVLGDQPEGLINTGTTRD